MSFDLQGIRDASVINMTMMRQHAIYLAAQRSDRTALMLDIKA